MRNFNETMIRHCLFMNYDEYQSLISDLTNGNAYVEFPVDGIDYISCGQKDYDSNNINMLLSEYFHVKVKSVHCDDNESNIGVWIHYEEF